jgi:uncharacterized protein YceH (UPF0502 family)
MKVPTDDPSYIRDKASKAIVNTNHQAFEEYRAKRNLQNRINTLEEEVKALNNKLDNVLNLLTKLVGN